MNSTKRILLIIAGIVASLILIIVILGSVYKDKVQNLVVESLNKNLDAEIEVESISFSLTSSFPYAEVEFVNITAKETTTFTTTGIVFNAQKLSLLFSFASIFSENYKLKKLVIENASVNLQVDKSGRANYEIWKMSNDTTSSALVFELENVVFKNVDVLYYNAMKVLDISFLVKDGSLKGDFKSKQYLLASEAELEKANIIIDNVKYLTGKSCEVKLGLDTNRDQGTYDFKESTLKLAGLRLNVDGNVTAIDNAQELDLKISSPEADLPSLLSLIPEKYIGKSKEYKYSGQVEFTGQVTGRVLATATGTPK